MHPIIFLWAHPRSMSTAIERVMRERGDLHCLHEPFLRYYYRYRSERTFPMFDNSAQQPARYEDIRALLLEQAEKTPVFAKDMSYYIIPELLKDLELFTRIKHCFLIRNPMRALLSYYKLDPELTLKEVGLEAQWVHYQQAQRWGLKPVILEAEAVQADPQAMMRRFWAELELPDAATALNWQTTAPIPNDWQHVAGWHQQVSQSAGIQRETIEQKQRAHRQFAEATQQTPHLQAYLAHHLPMYHALQEQALSLENNRRLDD